MRLCLRHCNLWHGGGVRPPRPRRRPRQTRRGRRAPPAPPKRTRRAQKQRSQELKKRGAQPIKGQSAGADLERGVYYPRKHQYLPSPRPREKVKVKVGEANFEPSNGSRAETHKTGPQLPWWCRQHRSERPRSKVRHHLQLCAKPPHHALAAQRATASSLPATGAVRGDLAASPRPVLGGFPR